MLEGRERSAMTRYLVFPLTLLLAAGGHAAKMGNSQSAHKISAQDRYF